MFEWPDFLTLGERLAAAPGDEAAQRTALSRAYYAAYHEAAAFVRTRNLLRERHSHLSVWGALSSAPAAELVEIGARGVYLKRLRTGADYKKPFPGDLRALSRDAIIEARAVIELLGRLG